MEPATLGLGLVYLFLHVLSGDTNVSGLVWFGGYFVEVFANANLKVDCIYSHTHFLIDVQLLLTVTCNHLLFHIVKTKKVALALALRLPF